MVAMDTKWRFQAFLIFFLVIFSLNMFFAKVVMASPLKHLCMAYMLGAVVLSIPYFFRGGKGFVLPLQLISVSVLASVLLSYVSWKQEFSFAVSTIPYLLWFVFFYLLHIRFPLPVIEKIVFFWGWVYILLFIFQFMNSSQVYFGFREEFKEDRGVIRILFPGAGVFFLAYFISLNRVMEKVRFRWVFALFILAGIAVTVLQVTKQSIVLLLGITLFHLLRKTSLFSRLLITAAFIGGVVLVLNSDNPVSRGIIESQKENVADGGQNIRVQGSLYFLTEFSPNTVSQIFGNGFPNLNSRYGQYVSMLEDNYGYYLTDVGVVGMYAMFGILPLLAYLMIFARGLTMRVPAEFQYLKYYLFYIMATCLTSDSIFSISFMMTNIFVFYALQVLFERERAVKHTYPIVLQHQRAGSLL